MQQTMKLLTKNQVYKKASRANARATQLVLDITRGRWIKASRCARANGV
jgi:hypothetical protein